MLMFDRISEISEQGGEHGKGLIRAELEVKPDLWFFACHFKGDPVMPGCLGVDALWQLLGFFLGWLGSPGKGRALGLGELKFSGQVLPTMKKVVYGIEIKRVMRSKLVLGIADGWLSADGNVIYRASDLQGRTVPAGRDAGAGRSLIAGFAVSPRTHVFPKMVRRAGLAGRSFEPSVAPSQRVHIEHLHDFRIGTVLNSRRKRQA